MNNKNSIKYINKMVSLVVIFSIVINLFAPSIYTSQATESKNENGSLIEYEITSSIPGFGGSGENSGSSVTNGGLRCENSDLNVPLYIQGNYQDYIQSLGGTIATIGCGLTSVAMCVSAITGQDIPPDVANRKIQTVSLGTNGSIWGVSSRQLPSGPFDVAIEELKKGNLVILGVGPSVFTDTMHFIVLKCIDSDGKIIINDPASEANSKKKWDPDVLYKASLGRKAEQYYVYETK